MTDAKRQRLLMCHPGHFAVNYVINPWMKDNQGCTETDLAHRQWENLRDCLERAGAEIALVEPQAGLPDMVFTANAGMVSGNRAVVSRFRDAERQGEEPFFRAAFTANGFEIVPWPKNVAFEGAGDALWDRGQPLLWMGHGFRSSLAAVDLLKKAFDAEVVPLKLSDPRFYHLDTCLCPLAGGHLLYYPPAFDAASLAAIESRVAPRLRIEATDADAVGFACNAVDIGDSVFLNAATGELKSKLKKAGFKAVVTQLSEFMKAGGAAKCLTLKLVE